MKLYTKTGDQGTTSLFGGQRVSKASLRVEAYGTVDETNSVIGLVRTQTAGFQREDDLLKSIQNDLFVLGADLATPVTATGPSQVPRISDLHIKEIEKQIDFYQAACPPFRFFVLPGGTPLAAHLHVARTVCRRAERIVVQLSESSPEFENIIVYLNRLSDLLFILARFVNLQTGVSETEWKVRG